MILDVHTRLDPVNGPSSSSVAEPVKFIFAPIAYIEFVVGVEIVTDGFPFITNKFDVEL